MNELMCRFCGKSTKKQTKMSISIHELRCAQNPEFNSERFHIPTRKSEIPSERTLKRKQSEVRKELCKKTLDFKCVYCQEDFSRENFDSSFLSLKLHESQCVANENYTRKRENWWKPFSEETKNKIRESTRKQVWTEERRKKHRKSMAKAVQENPEAYTSSNRGRVKQIEIDGFKLHGKWELTFYQWAKQENLTPIRCLESFPYEWEGTHRYFPDFYLPTLDLYVEVKGYETDRDKAKWKYFPKRLVVLRQDSIDKMKKGRFELNQIFLFEVERVGLEPTMNGL